MKIPISDKQLTEMQGDLLEHASDYIGISKQVTGTGECTLLGGLIGDNHIGMVAVSMRSEDEMYKLLDGLDKYITKWMDENSTKVAHVTH